MESRESFCQLCQHVQLEEGLREKAWNFWESVATRVGETIKCGLIPWFICAIYITNCNERLNGTEPGVISLSDLLKVAKMRLVEFFQKMKELMDICNIGSRALESLAELKKTFCISAALFYKFNRVMPLVFQDHQTLGESNDTKDTFCKHCWLLFIVCKGWQMHKVTDLMTSFHLLLCCIDHVHRRFLLLRQQASDVTGMNITLQQGILQDLCQESNVPYSKVFMVYSQYFQPFLDSCSLDDTKDVLNIENLNSMYEEIYSRTGDGIDERDFFDKDGYLWIQFNELQSSNNLNGNATSTCTSVSETHSLATTTATITTEIREPAYPPITELRTALDQTSDSPSDELLRFWSGCRRDPQNIIESKLTGVQKLFVKNFTEAVGEENSSVSHEIFAQAKKLYFRVMGAMLVAEEKRLLCSDFSALLNSEAFHVSLLACSLEVIIADSGLSWPALEFPWILSVVKLKAFDFFKVTESFILHEPLLGSNLIKHLNRTEEQVLERLAWTTDSPLLKALEASHLLSDPNSMSPEKQHKKSQPLNLFLRKVNQMAYLRLTSVCNELDIDELLRGHMWTCLEQSLRFHWQLMKDRHLDQMLLCAVYAISKVVGREIQFKQIVSSYKTLPFASAHVYRGTPVTGKEADSIIGFYNRVYMVTMKPVILQFAPSKNPPVSPAPKSSLRFLGKKNVYLSPLRGSPSDILTPKSRSLYNFGESPGSGDRESLSRINASMRAAGLSQPRPPQKRLRFEECENTDNGAVLTNGHSSSGKEAEKEAGSQVNGTNGSTDHDKPECIQSS